MGAFREDIKRWAHQSWRPQGAEPVPCELTAGLVVRLLWRHPALVATGIYRMSHWAHVHRLRGLPSLLERVNLVLFGLEISSSIPIGPGLYVAHPVGTVLMAKQIGANASFIHAVTLGMRNTHDFPTLGDAVFVGAGARILGGIAVGDRATIGANAVVIADVPPGRTAVGVPARLVAEQRS